MILKREGTSLMQQYIVHTGRFCRSSLVSPPDRRGHALRASSGAGTWAGAGSGGGGEPSASEWPSRTCAADCHRSEWGDIFGDHEVIPRYTLGWSKNGGKNDFFEVLRSYLLNLLLAMRNTSCENFIKIGQLYNPGFGPRNLSSPKAPALKSLSVKAIAK